MTEDAPRVPPIGTRTKLLFGSGGAALGVKDSGFSYFLLLFYNQVVGLPATWVGTALMISLIVDGVVDVSVGKASDRLRSRWGRRHPFMYAAALPLAVSYCLLWNPPDQASQGVLFAYLLALAIAVRLSLALYEAPSAALVSELTEDYDERTSFMNIRVFLAFVGGFLAGVLTYVFFLQPSAAHPVGQLNPEGYAKMGVAGAIIMFAAILISSLATHRYIPFLRRPPQRDAEGFGAIGRSIVATLANPSLRALLLAGVSSSIATGLGSALNIYIFTYFWQLEPDQIAVLSSGYFAGIALAFVVAPKIARNFGKREAAILLSAAGLTISLGPVVLRLLGAFPGPGDAALLPLLIATSALAMTCTMSTVVMVSAMLADIVEDHEVATGERAEGTVFAANLFIQKCVSGIGVFASGVVLSLADFPQQALPQEVAPATVRNLVIVFLCIQTFCSVTAMFMTSRYQISRDRHAENLDTLRRRAAQRA